MEERFRLNALNVDYGQHDWPSALTVVGELMLKLGSIEEPYITAMIKAVEDLGPYMVIIPHLAIAHAAFFTHVLKDDMVMVVFKQPIIFNSNNDPVHIIIGLCAKSPHSHLQAFQYLSEIFNDENAWLEFFNCDTAEELYKLINS